MLVLMIPESLYLTADNFEESKIIAAGDEIPYSAIKIGIFTDSSAFAFEAFHVHDFEHIHFLLACKQSALSCKCRSLIHY